MEFNGPLVNESPRVDETDNNESAHPSPPHTHMERILTENVNHLFIIIAPVEEGNQREEENYLRSQ